MRIEGLYGLLRKIEKLHHQSILVVTLLDYTKIYPYITHIVLDD